MILKGKNVTLRPLIEVDFDQYYKWHSDNEIRFQTMMHPYPVTEKLEKIWFEKAISDISNKRYLFSIIYNENNQLIGYFQLTDVNFINRNANLGIVIGEKDYQEKGLGKEIMQLGLDYGFNYLGLYKIFLEVLTNNKKAIRLYEKVNFQIEGEKKQHFFWNNKYYNILLMSKINN
ncbi:MAG: GNAT family protein [Bacteroidales bacterium]|jgi:RimJ/RimL family protein N-acetyltransferase|nr:GNAT family protein [Bacteroidales bacterium]